MEGKKIQFSTAIGRVSSQEIDALLVGINQSPGFHNITRKELVNYCNKNSVIAARVGKELLGIAAINRISKEWSEIAILFVFPLYRGKGIGKALWERSFSFLQNQNIFLVTTNDKVRKLASNHHFMPRPFFKLPANLIAHNFKHRFRFGKIQNFIREYFHKRARFKKFSFLILKKHKQIA